MHVIFYHEGNEVELPRMMASSVKFHNPRLPVVQVSDPRTPRIDGVDIHLKFDIKVHGIMFRRAIAYSYAQRTLGCLGIFVDTDMLFIDEIGFNTELLSTVNSIVLCKRSYDNDAILNHKQHPGLDHFAGMRLGECFPYLGSFMVAGTAAPLNKIVEEMSALSSEQQQWYGDQTALVSLASSPEILVCEVPESRYGYVPNSSLLPSRRELNDVKIIHFKGARKKLMPKIYQNLASKLP